MAMTPPIMPVGSLDHATTHDARRLSAFDLAPDHGVTAPPAAPDAAQLVLETFSGFQDSAAKVQSALHALVPSPTIPATAVPMAPDGPAHGLGVMMEVFDFAIQSELVSRAATTFTSSVNTLIKTQ